MTQKCHWEKSFSAFGIVKEVCLGNDRTLKCLSPFSGIGLCTQIESGVFLVSGEANSYTRGHRLWSIVSNSYHWNLAALSFHQQVVHQRPLCRQVPLCGHVWLGEVASKVRRRLHQWDSIYLYCGRWAILSRLSYQSLTTAVGSNYWSKVGKRPYLVRALERLKVFQFNWN